MAEIKCEHSPALTRCHSRAHRHKGSLRFIGFRRKNLTIKPKS